MNNNVYVRSNKSIKSISLTRMLFILPMIIYGFYKNGIYLYQNDYISIFAMFRPLILIFGGATIGVLVNLIYEYLIKRRKENLIEAIFSSFHMEYGLLLGCVVPININMLIFFISIFIMLFISKFLNDRVNIVSIIFIIIYVISINTTGFNFANIYETTKSFSLDFMDYLIGRGPGGVASTHIILLAVAVIGLFITNNSKSNITLYSVISFIVPMIIYSIVKDVNISTLIFSNNYLFIFSLIATDSITSCYTTNGMRVFGILIGIITFGLYFLNPVIAPYIAIATISLFNNLIDRKTNIC